MTKPLALVTGPSRGIGRATVEALARRGCRMVLFGRPSADLLAVERALAQAGTVVEVVHARLEDPAEIAAGIDALSARALVPDIVVHNAGHIERASIEDTSPEAYELQLAVNLRAPFLLTRALLPGMRARGSGRIVCIGSISSTLGAASAAAYCASKWGLVGFMKSLAEELRDSGLMTVALLPGSVDTSMLSGSGFAPRMSADEVAKTVAYLCLDAPLAHNGAVIEMFGV
jgi:3-oxoacyl-[acyl-carrier protein] reductase